MEIHAKKVEERCRVCGRFLGYIPGLHMTQGVFMKLFRLLEATCHQFDLQLAYTYRKKAAAHPYSQSTLKSCTSCRWPRLSWLKPRLLGSFRGSCHVRSGGIWGGQPCYGYPYQACPGQEAVCGENGKD